MRTSAPWRPYVVHELAGRGILGNDVLWFQLGPEPGTGLQKPISPEDWRQLSMASLTTHDLPTAAGFLAGEHVRVREELGLLTGTAPRSGSRRGTSGRRGSRRCAGAVSCRTTAEPSDDEIILPCTSGWRASSARLLGGSLSDVVGDVRQPNLPGTIDEYPCWRIPVADRHGHPLLLEQIMAAPMAAQVARALSRSDTVSGS